MDHFTKGQTIKKHSAVDDDRQGEERGGGAVREGDGHTAESLPLQPTCSPGVLLLLLLLLLFSPSETALGQNCTKTTRH